MNKADNEAGNAAIDSLLNYETVKVRSNPLPSHTHNQTFHPIRLLFVNSSPLSPPFLVFFFHSLKPGTLK